MRQHRRTSVRGVSYAPRIEPTGDTDRIILFSNTNFVSVDYEERSSMLDALHRRADQVIPKFDCFFSLMEGRTKL